ncbi:MAG: DUF885 domain-containing protein [Verrucomicrobia bacterium]|jgi:uncharacterized protein (DUF885 family)|nr:DUF885 domain-containing protein [Verrucomicrobiota bacterium]
MIRRLAPTLLISVFFLWLPALNAATNPASTNQEFAQVLDDYWEAHLELHPLQATAAGDHRFDHLLPNPLDPAHRRNLKSFYQEYRAKVAKFKSDSLTKEERLSKELLTWDCNVQLKQLTFPKHLLPLNQFESFHLTIGQLAGGSGAHPFKTTKDYQNWLQRLNQFYPWCASAISAMKTGVQKGHTLPKSLTIKVIPQIADLAKRPVTEHLFYKPILQLPDSFTEEEKQTLTKQYKEILSQRIIPAFEALEDYLKNDYLPHCRDSSGYSAIPDGQAYYRHQIKIYTTTDMTPDEIFHLGEAEVRRLSSEMEKIKMELNFKGTLKEFFDHVRTAPKLTPFTKPQEVIDNFNLIHQRMTPQVKRLFRLTPKTAFEVRRTEAFREASSSAEYQPGSFDGTRPGIFYVPIPNVLKYNIFSDEDLFLHEAIPGHHYQISLQQENTKLPQFRRPIWYNAYGEGWALYCESLGKELGLYEDPYQYFGMLSAEMHRAIRLVVDVGLHDKGWSREKAIQYSLDHEAEPEASIVSEIERYMSWPGQALSYKIGQLKIMDLRARAQESLGKAFDIRDFHDEVLESGCLPLKVLEQKIQAWIDKTRE